MNKHFSASAGSNPVDAAIAAGKILPSRRAVYLEKLKKRPKATAKLLDELEPVFMDDYAPEYPDGSAQPGYDESASPVRAQAAQAGPTDYPKEWLRAAEVAGFVGGSIIDATSYETAMAAGPGEVL